MLPKSLAAQSEDPVLLHKHLPKEKDIDRLLEQINRKETPIYQDLLETWKQLILIGLTSETFTSIYNKIVYHLIKKTS